MAAPSFPPSLLQALRHFAIVVAMLSLAFAATYALPGLARFRPWQPGDALPLVGLWRRASASPRPAPSPAPAPPQATEHKPAAPHASAPTPEETQGIQVFIEDPGGRGMQPFYAKLQQTAAQQGQAITRIAHYGDSSIATDHITYTLRRQLQQRFGDAGHGFVLVAATYLPYRHRDLRHESNDAWSLVPIMNRADPLGRYGYGGVQVRSKPGSWALVGVDEEAPVGRRLSRFELWLQRYEHGGTLELRIDGKDARRVSGAAPSVQDAIERIDLADGAHTLAIKHAGGGAVRLYGVVLEREGPGVVYDSLGLVGARAVRLLNFDAAHIAAQLQARQTNLLVLGFGGNEAGDPLSNVEHYEEGYAQVIAHMRGTRPTHGCLLFAPLDQGSIDERGRIVSMPTVLRIVEAQRRAALAAGCAFYNTFEAMGGRDAMRRWYEGKPRLALGDLRHATPAGYERIGSMFYKALLKGFADYLAAQAASAPAPAAPLASPPPSPTK